MKFLHLLITPNSQLTMHSPGHPTGLGARVKVKSGLGHHLMVLLTFCLNFSPTTLTTCSSCFTDVVRYFHDTKHESAVSALSTATVGTGRPLLCCSHASKQHVRHDDFRGCCTVLTD